MELSRQEYPALLGSLQPQEAVSLLNDRVRLIGKVNVNIADWLLERRRVEEAYVQGLKKLASRRQQDGPADLGIFQSPWQSIVSSTESLADSHSVLATRIEADVERPLREYQRKNRELQSMSTMQGNLTAIAKECEEAQKRSDRLKAKGGKADAHKVSNATSDAESANQQWESQAPYVFEQLQALDESRLNHLRDVLTQFETHEVDQVERNRVTAESCLNVLLNVNTGDEISTFVARTSGGRSDIPQRRQSRTPTISAGAPPTPARSVDDRRSEIHAATGVPSVTPKSSFGGLKRLGTVISRRKQDTNPPPMPSPDKRSKSSRNPLKRGPSSRNMQQIPSPNASTSELPLSLPRQETLPKRTASDEQRPDRTLSEQQNTRGELNGEPMRPNASETLGSTMTNGAHSDRGIMPLQELHSRPSTSKPEEGERDSEGFNVPPAALDDVTRAQQEAASENEQLQFKLDIRNEPIQEEDNDAQTAISKVANTLRAQQQQVPQQRKLGVNRGRRDVRNTIFIPSPQTPETHAVAESLLPPASPFINSRMSNMTPDDGRGSDAQSIRSAHSLASLAHPVIKHPEMHEAGLNASIIETVSATFSGGQVTKAVVMGELALAYNGSEAKSESRTDTIRLENFPVLEKVAPNPTFISQVPSKSGEYNVNFAQLGRTSVAFKYQVHLDEASLATHAPIMLTANWKVEPRQTSVILGYSFNTEFSSAAKRSVSLQNVIVYINIEGTKAVSCLSKPVGNFSKEKSRIYWKLGDLTLDAYQEAPQKVLARFTTEAEARPGEIEARWEICGEHASGLGSGLSLSQPVSTKEDTKEDWADPFADEGAAPPSVVTYKEVPVIRRLLSSRYVAV